VAVRVGGSTFALRRVEAAAVRIQRIAPPVAA
jgi:Fe2+ transport system protein FeoA